MIESKEKNNISFTRKLIMLLVSIILFIVFSYFTISKYIKTFSYIKTNATFVELVHCDNQNCKVKYKYNNNNYYITPYQSSQKPNEIETIYYNPDNPNEAFMINLNIDIIIFLFSLIFILLPLISFIKNKKISSIITNITILLSLMFFSIILLTFIPGLKNFLLLFTSITYILIVILKNLKNKKHKTCVYSIIKIETGLLLIFNFLTFFTIIGGSILVFDGVKNLFKQIKNKNLENDIICQENPKKDIENNNIYQEETKKVIEKEVEFYKNVIFKTIRISYIIILTLIIVPFVIVLFLDPPNTFSEMRFFIIFFISIIIFIINYYKIKKNK